MLVGVTVPGRRFCGFGKHTALRALTRPWRQSVPVPAIGSAVPVMRSMTACAEVMAQLVLTSAARPATRGAAIEVPLFVTKPPVFEVDRTLVPGAARSTHRPRVE